MFETLEVRGIPLQAVQNLDIFANFLINKERVQTGKLIAINAEKVVLSQEPELGKILKHNEWNYADGVSVVCTLKKKYPQYQNLERIAGADLWQALMKRAGDLQVPVFLIGAKENVLTQTLEKLKEQNIAVVGWQDGYFTDEEGLLERVKQSGAKFISVAMGSPKQERLMIKLQEAHPKALYMGVGGTYDVFVGAAKRAPKSWQKLGLEWFYRLLQQPTRYKRQFNLLKYTYYYLTKQL
ncbi:lipopolysaccharide N-acetylmannosaminouronosyltransferase [Pasteurellaceae bacterium RH1A]|nr:lipopolysaccharide N-acetylmannosaminouronosyltransferase [Pasteurellaceae bacterium RH1A]